MSAVLLECLNYALIAYQTTYYDEVSFGSILWQSLRDGGLRGMLVSLVWALYWMRSKRVRLTYGANGFDRGTSLPIEPSTQVT